MEQNWDLWQIFRDFGCRSVLLLGGEREGRRLVTRSWVAHEKMSESYGYLVQIQKKDLDPDSLEWFYDVLYDKWFTIRKEMCL